MPASYECSGGAGRADGLRVAWTTLSPAERKRERERGRKEEREAERKRERERARANQSFVFQLSFCSPTVFIMCKYVTAKYPPK